MSGHFLCEEKGHRNGVLWFFLNLYVYFINWSGVDETGCEDLYVSQDERVAEVSTQLGA
jgi:hypothetical protein